MLYLPVSKQEATIRFSMANQFSTQAVIVQTQEEERHRLAHALQTGPAQVLANAALEVETCLNLMEEQPQAARQGLAALMYELRASLSDLREFINELQPPLLKELGLGTSLQKYAERFSERTKISVTLVGLSIFNERLPATVEMSIFRIAQEAFENVYQHANANHILLELSHADNSLKMVITDDGKGFDTRQNSVPERRLGLVAMRDRADLLGGTLQIFSEPGQGVQVVLSAPLRLPVSSAE